MKMLLCALSLALVLTTAAHAADSTATIEIRNFKFNPPALTVHAGESVTWINRDETPHTVAEANKSFRSAALDTGDKFSHAFTAPGTYTYFCTMHPQMTGTVTVLP